ncbi:SDR family oxidoreductase [Aminobacter anthyllidis]|uniref:SDR family oxidoreductase n=1 Tax=Aminobacter anthyllidis TaxID=1035067 RepID=A0A9X1D1W0_9HYPH|nr:SDR family oxidoreductase [Aminobacter anthyllidis]MBT1154785.1 SDR family oxidoreductase [Aminobacter anthyllidis]
MPSHNDTKEVSGLELGGSGPSRAELGGDALARQSAGHELSQLELRGKVALVTGGSRGIGAAIAIQLATSGADVALTYVRSAEKADTVVGQIDALGRRGLAIQADNADAEAVEAAVTATIAAFGRLDILVNSAGIWHAGTIDTVSLEQLDEVMSVNFRAPFIASKAAAGVMHDGGRIISIGSNLADRVPFEGIALYSASKAALVGLTKGLARDLGPRGITVNVVHPGSTETDMNPAEGDVADYQRSLMAIPQFGSPDDIAGLVTWLAGPQARFVTGAALTIDGGTNA